MNTRSSFVRAFLISAVVLVAALCASAASVSPRSTHAKAKSSRITESAHAQRRMSQLRHSRVVRASVRVRSRRRFTERFATSSFAEDQALGDAIGGEDPTVRQAAIDALGNMNGTVVAIDPGSGRVLAMVNQRLALSAGAIPCSTIKVPVALAALSENLISKDSKVMLNRQYGMTLTEALAHSNNLYFETVGRRLGFEKYSYYAHQYGLGELAGWNIPGEQPGVFPSTPLEDKLGGVGKMCSFGQSISMTPLQLGALLSAIANGGTLYYLQHPASIDDVVNFQPRVKRHLDIAPVLPQIVPGMAAVVQYGTGRSVRLSFSDEPVLGKTGTCSNNAGTRYGWFGSFANTDAGRIVVVVFLQGGRPTYGPKAAEITGHLYRNLEEHNFFESKPSVKSTSTAGIGTTGIN